MAADATTSFYPSCCCLNDLPFPQLPMGIGRWTWLEIGPRVHRLVENAISILEG